MKNHGPPGALDILGTLEYTRCMRIITRLHPAFEFEVARIFMTTGMSARALAKMYGISHTSVLRIAKKHGYQGEAFYNNVREQQRNS